MYDISITISVTDLHWEHARRNIILTERQNQKTRIYWIIVANNHDPEVPIPDSIISNPNVLLLEGFPFEQFANEHRPGSSSHAAATKLGLDNAVTRFFVQLDADFFVIYPNWISEVLRKMKQDDIGVWGASWHIKRFDKWRDFPSPHLSVFDLEKLDRRKLDFRPDFGAYFDYKSPPKFHRNWLFVEMLRWQIEANKKALQESKYEERAIRLRVGEKANFPLQKPMEQIYSPENLSELRSLVRKDALAIDHSQWIRDLDLYKFEPDRAKELVKSGRQLAEAFRDRYERKSTGPYEPSRRDLMRLSRAEIHASTLQRGIKEASLAIDDIEEKLKKGIWRDKFTKPFAMLLKKADKRYRDFFFNRYKIWAKRCEIAGSADTNIRIYKYCKENGVKVGMPKLSIGIEDYGFKYSWPILKQVRFILSIYLSQLVPIRFRLRPLKHPILTKQRFSDRALPDFRAIGWEEYFWNNEPFAVHIRTTSRRYNRPQSKVQEAWLNNFLEQAIGEKFTSRHKFDPILSSFEENQVEDKGKIARINEFAGEHTNFLQNDDANIDRLIDKYKEKRCFLVANGPSLTPEDLDKIKGEVSFACNKIYLLYGKTDWRPDFFFCEDSLVLRQNRDKIKDLTNVTKVLPRRLLNGDGFLPRYAPDGIYYDLNYPNWRRLNNPSDLFSLKPSEGLNAGGTVLYSMLQMAVIMGFSEIVILGFDRSFDMRKEDPAIRLNVEVGDYLSPQDVRLFITRSGYMDQSGRARRLGVIGSECLDYPGDFVWEKHEDSDVFYVYSRMALNKIRLEICDYHVKSLHVLDMYTDQPKWDVVQETFIPNFLLVSKGEQNHFAEAYRKPAETWSTPNPRTIDKAMDVAAKVAEARGCKIYNATRGRGLNNSFVFRELEDILSTDREKSAS